VASVSRVPVAAGKFEVVIDVELGAGTEFLVPGMTATVQPRHDDNGTDEQPKDSDEDDEENDDD
jgi:hypothetical protein